MTNSTEEDDGGELSKPDKIGNYTRVEVIDHQKDNKPSDVRNKFVGRKDNKEVEVLIDEQDDGRTLKVFIQD